MPGKLIRNDTELSAAWRGLMGTGGFGQRCLWLIFFDDRSRLQPVIMPIEDIPSEPDALVVANLARVVGELIDDGTASSCALLLSRPGADSMTDSDRTWARALRTEFGTRSPWPVHLATRNSVRVFAPDDLLIA
jgi:hypothetical protein